MSQKMLACIRNSIKNESALKHENTGKEPTISITTGLHKKTAEDGPLFFKIMISRISIDSRSIVT